MSLCSPVTSLFTLGSRLRSSCIAEPRRGSMHVLGAGGVGPAASDQSEGRGQQPPLRT